MHTSRSATVTARMGLAAAACFCVAVVMVACAGEQERGAPVGAGFADQVSVLEIVSERQLPLQAEVEAIGEGYVGREVRARIESTLWRRPGAPAATGEVSLRVWGWLAHDHELAPILPRVEVGNRILAALVKTPEWPWALLSEGAAIPVAASRVAPSETQLKAYPLIAPALRGKTLAQISRLLASTRPSELAAKYQHLDAAARAGAVWAEMLEPNSAGQP